MVVSYKTVFFLAGLALLFTSCNDDDAEDDFANSANIKGRINVQNEFQQPLYDERDNVEVILEVGFRSFDILGDVTGNWQLAGAPVGTYTITYIKPGFSTIVQRGIGVSVTSPNYPIVDGFQQLPSVTLTKLPQTEFSNFELDLSFTTSGTEPDIDTLYTLDVSATILPAPPPTGQAKGYRIFIGTDEEVSPANYIYQEYFTTTTANINLSFEDEWFNELGLASGDAIFAVLYGDANFNLTLENPDETLSFPNLSAQSGAFSSVVLP